MGFFGYFEKYYINLSFGWNYIVSMLILTIEISLVMNSFKYNLKGILFKLLDCIITFGIEIFIFCLAEFLLGSHQYINYICWPIIIFSHAFYFCHYKAFDRLSKGLCLTIILYLEPMISSSICDLFGITNFPVATTIFTIIFALATSFFMPKFTLKKTEKINYVCLLLMIFLVAFTIAFIIVDLPEGEKSLNAWSHFTIYILIATFALISYYYFYRLNVDFNNSLQSQALLIREEQNRLALETSRANLEDLRRRRHDMKNQYQYMRLLLEKGEKDQLNLFFQQMVKGTEISKNPSETPSNHIHIFQNRLQNTYPECSFIFHDNITNDANDFLIEIEDTLFLLIKKNLQKGENEIWLEGDKKELFLTFKSSDKNRNVEKISKGELEIDPFIEETQKGTYLTYKIYKKEN